MRSTSATGALMSVTVVGWVITSVLQQAVARTQQFGQEVIDAYNRTLPVIGAGLALGVVLTRRRRRQLGPHPQRIGGRPRESVPIPRPAV